MTCCRAAWRATGGCHCCSAPEVLRRCRCYALHSVNKLIMHSVGILRACRIAARVAGSGRATVARPLLPPAGSTTGTCAITCDALYMSRKRNLREGGRLAPRPFRFAPRPFWLDIISIRRESATGTFQGGTPARARLSRTSEKNRAAGLDILRHDRMPIGCRARTSLHVGVREGESATPTGSSAQPCGVFDGIFRQAGDWRPSAPAMLHQRSVLT